MSFNNILSDTGPSESQPAPASISPDKVSRELPASVAPPHTHVKSEIAPPTAIQEVAATNGLPARDTVKLERNGVAAPPPLNTATPSTPSATTQSTPPAPQRLPPGITGPPGLTVHKTEEAYLDIERAEASDVEAPGFEMLQQQWQDRGLKRAADVDTREAGKRKVNIRNSRALLEPQLTSHPAAQSSADQALSRNLHLERHPCSRSVRRRSREASRRRSAQPRCRGGERTKEGHAAQATPREDAAERDTKAR